MQIVSALFTENLDIRQVPGPSTRIDLMGVMFDEADLAQQQRLKCAFDPDGLLNPGKVFPTLHRCAELGRLHVHLGRLPHPDLPRF